MLLVLDGVNLPGRRLLGGAHYRDLPLSDATLSTLAAAVYVIIGHFRPKT